MERDLGLIERLTDRASLVAALCAFHGFFAGLEAILAARLEPDILAGRARLPELAHDLAALGLSPDAIGSLPVCRRIALAGGHDEAMGALYVAEGARLGGRLIARHIAAHAIAPGAALRFWNDDAARVQALWGSFRERLEDVASASDAARGAVATFDALREWLRQEPAAGLHAPRSGARNAASRPAGA